jgi:hypothetical protein
MLCLPRKRVNSIRQLDDILSNSIIKASFQPEIGVVNKPRFTTNPPSNNKKTLRKLPVAKIQSRSGYKPLTPMGH